MMKHIQNLTFVLHMINLFRLKDLNLFQYFGCKKLASLFVLHQSNSPESAYISSCLPTPIVVNI